MIWVTSLDTPWMQSYAEIPYEEYPVNDKFKDITTIADLNRLDSFVRSPTECRFVRNHEGRGIFYRDQQDCYIWMQDPETKEIYAEDRSGIRNCVAKSLPEFLSKLEFENQTWWDRYKKRQELP